MTEHIHTVIAVAVAAVLFVLWRLRSKTADVTLYAPAKGYDSTSEAWVKLAMSTFLGDDSVRYIEVDAATAIYFVRDVDGVPSIPHKFKLSDAEVLRLQEMLNENKRGN